MALNTPSSDSQENQAGNAAQAAEPPRVVFNKPQGDAAKAPAQGWSFHDGGLFGAPISRGVGSEDFLKLKTALTEIYKAALDDVEIALLDLDNGSEPTLAYSSIIVAVRLKNTAKSAAAYRGVAYHILLLESTSEKLTPIMENINGEQIEIQRVTSDAMDAVLYAKAHERVVRAFPQGPWYCADGTVIPSTFDLDNKHSLHKLALNAGLAANNELQIHSETFRDVNLAALQSDGSLTINISTTPEQVLDAVGMPNRSDFSVTLMSKRNNTSRQTSVNSGDREVPVSRLTGFLDLVWCPVAPQAPAIAAYAPAVPQATQKYVARMVLSTLTNNFSYTPASILLALATASSMREENNWIQVFRPTPPQGKSVDLRDIGALNIEANLMNAPTGFGERIRTKDDSFGLVELGQYVAALIQAGLLISIDVPEAGAQSWYTNVFAAASGGHPGAVQQIIEAATELTNGNFPRYFHPNSPIFIDPNNRIHAGTWTDNNGNVRDLRDFDHLAVCNLIGERNPIYIKDWSDTFLNRRYPLVKRLAARKRMIQDLSNNTAVFTGFYQRVTFSGEFIEALMKGINDTGFQLARVNTPLSSADFSNARGVADFASQGLVRPGRSFSQAPGFNNFNASQFGGGNFSNNRW